MILPQFKTLAEQRLDYLQSLHRPLDDEESDELRRALHAVYARNRRLEIAATIDRELHGRALPEYRRHEHRTLCKVLAESLPLTPGER